TPFLHGQCRASHSCSGQRPARSSNEPGRAAAGLALEAVRTPIGRDDHFQPGNNIIWANWVSSLLSGVTATNTTPARLFIQGESRDRKRPIAIDGFRGAESHRWLLRRILPPLTHPNTTACQVHR